MAPSRTEASPLLSLDRAAPMHGHYTEVVDKPRRPKLLLRQLLGALSMPSAVNPSTLSPRRNPFHYNAPIDCYERTKILVLCLLGVPLVRLLLLLVAGVLLGLVCVVATIGYSPVDPKTKQRKPFPRWRRVLASPRPLLVRVVLFALGYHWISVKTPKDGLPDEKNAPRIVVSNHTGFIDGPFFAYYLNSSIAMKAELGRIPIVGRVIQTLQPILIDRNTSEGRKQAINDIADHLANPEYPPLLIFPEGTTSNQDFLTKFKVGSFASGIACQPVTLKYPFKHFDVSWTPDVSALYLFARMLCQVHNRLEVEFLPPYYPTEEEKQHPEIYAENVRQVMAQSLGVTCTNHAFEDVALLLRVGNYADQHVVSITDVGEIANLTSLRANDVQRLVHYYIQRDLNGDGQISEDELMALFPDDSPELLERLFALLDADSNGSIDFRELCMGLAALNPTRDSSELVRFSFRLYDLDGNGIIDKSELDAMLTFFKSFYGEQDEAIKSELLLDENGQVTFEAFSNFMELHPIFLGHAKSKLEALRGSFSASPKPNK